MHMQCTAIEQLGYLDSRLVVGLLEQSALHLLASAIHRRGVDHRRQQRRQSRDLTTRALSQIVQLPWILSHQHSRPGG
jgi:hypothetical protein